MPELSHTRCGFGVVSVLCSGRILFFFTRVYAREPFGTRSKVTALATLIKFGEVDINKFTSQTVRVVRIAGYLASQA